jgi:hypothetical protein
METIDLTLAIIYNGVKIRVEKKLIKGFELYGVVFADKRQPLVMTVATKSSGKQFWTSVPEGRQQEAEAIGALIDNHYKLL